MYSVWASMVYILSMVCLISTWSYIDPDEIIEQVYFYVTKNQYPGMQAKVESK